VAAKTTDNIRDRRLVTLAGILPDVDGLGVVVDMVTSSGGHRGTQLYWQYHHLLLHGLAGGVLISLSLACFARQRLRVFLLGLCVFHLHLLCDFVGSRGPSVDDVWPIFYFGPFTKDPMWMWRDQWALDAWQNRVISVILFLWSLGLAIKLGDSFVGVFNHKLDRVFVGVLRRWREELARKHAKAESVLLSRSFGLLVGMLILAFGLTYQAHLTKAKSAVTARIAQNLRQIEAAKRAWALAHHETGPVNINKADLAGFLPGELNGWVESIGGERYYPKRLTESPEVVLTSELQDYPAGTVFRLTTNVQLTVVHGRYH